ncbi:hypothetical protein ACFQX7_37645 [Luedemannella flava]
MTIAGAAIGPRTVLVCLVTDSRRSLRLAIGADTARALPGTAVTFTVTATDTSDAAYAGTEATFAIPLGPVLDDAAYRDASTDTGAVTFDPGTATLTWTGPLAAHATANIRFSVTVRPAGAGDGIMTSAVTSTAAANNCPATGTRGVDCVVAVPVAAPTLNLTLDPPAVDLPGAPGATVTRADAVTATVTTDNLTGYSLNVHATADELTPAAGTTPTGSRWRA